MVSGMGAMNLGSVNMDSMGVKNNTSGG